jgi:tetratricopeptide (TPR) repeat protein
VDLFIAAEGKDMTKPTPVRIWTQEVDLPTYLVGAPNRNPMFLEKRVYQGSSGRVYPYPVIDRISEEKVAERHTVVFLENAYLKLMVMPGFGGRIQYAYDKTNNYPFIYHNRVIKPALVGLAGPWLSGGIEFNWPQHHRPGTYCPVDHAVTRNGNGSMTLWLSEIEPMWHLKSTLGLTLYPGKAFLEIDIRLFNATALRQSFHLWTNPAVHVNDQYQSVFPPDVQAVYDHGKRDVSAFPIARGQYYKVDYSRGIDISWYKNIPVPTSYMAAKSNYNFVGGYDHGKQAGMLHVADHHVIPGKKQWVWGCGDFGKAWDGNLTDADGPYAELMCGVFADNQPDFSWLEPFEEKQVKQYFLPYKVIGYVRNATIDAAVSLEIARGKARLGAYVTAVRPRAQVRLSHRGREIWLKKTDLSPRDPLTAQVSLAKGIRPAELELTVLSAEGQKLVSYKPEPRQAKAIPEPAKAIPQPRNVATNEALYLAGLHLEQYRHATREPEAYYREAVRRDPEDVRSNNALGLLLLRRGQFAQAEPYFRAAIRTQTRHNPNPQDGEPYYNLGVCLRYLGREQEAFDAFYKASWNAALQDAAFFQLARIAAARGEWDNALDFVDRALARNAHNQKATHLKTMLLRKMGRRQEARELAQRAIARDPHDVWARNELLALGRSDGPETKRARKRNQSPDGATSIHTCLEVASDYAQAGAFAEAIDLLKRAPRGSSRTAGHAGELGMPNARPMVFYFAGYYAIQEGDSRRATKYFKMAAAQRPDCCFPNSLDSILALQAALKINPRDARANFYLGNLWYDKRQASEATTCWESARILAPASATVHRNLALVYFNKQHSRQKALRAMEQAFGLNPTDARVLFELDLLKKRAGIGPKQRFAFLKAHRDQVETREDLLVEFITLLNLFGRHDEALEILMNRQFHPWEGGEGKVTGQYVTCLTEMAKALLGAKDEFRSPKRQFRTRGDLYASFLPASAPEEEERRVERAFRSSKTREAQTDLYTAIELLERARNYPPNLGEGKLHGSQENQILFWLGVAHTRVGEKEKAKQYFKEACVGMEAPSQAVYYNDQNPETIFYQGLARQNLGQETRARERFRTLVDFAKRHLNDHVVIDYFAVSLPEFMVFDDDLDRRNKINCRYLIALGLWGLAKRASSLRELKNTLKLDPGHLAAHLHLRMFRSVRRLA